MVVEGGEETDKCKSTNPEISIGFRIFQLRRRWVDRIALYICSVLKWPVKKIIFYLYLTYYFGNVSRFIRKYDKNEIK